MPDESRPSLIPLHAGVVPAWLDGVDLRWVGGACEPLLDRVYVAVRGADWSTVPGAITELAIDARERSFDVSFTSSHLAAGLDFVWHGRLVGREDGVIECDLEGEAKSEFEYCRIGFCVHHPDRLASAAYRAWTADGEVRGRLPRLVAPQVLRGGAVASPLPHFARLMVTSSVGESVVIGSDGEPFELEDQRNWTDASFKSYIPPIRPGYPYRARRGQRFEQHMTIRIEARPSLRAASRGEPTRLEIAPATERSLPAIGFGLPHLPCRPSPPALERIARLHPDHLRLSAWVSRADVVDAVDHAIEQARMLGCPLEVSLFVSGNDTRQLEDVVMRLAASEVSVARWLAFDAHDADRRTTGYAVLALVRSVLGRHRPEAELAAGTASDFVWLNRDRTMSPGVAAVAWAIQPSRHASDDRSIMENATAQGITVETARAFAQGRSLCVGPVELVRRPQPADPRQRTALAAAWTVASLADLCPAGPDSITYFETIGPRGIMNVDGQPYPVCEVFDQLALMRGGSLRPVASSAHRLVTGLAVLQGDVTIGIAANHTPDRQRVEIHGLDRGPREMALGPYEVVRI